MAEENTQIEFRPTASFSGEIEAIGSGMFAISGTDHAQVMIQGESLQIWNGKVAFQDETDGIIESSLVQEAPTWIEQGKAGSGHAAVESKGSWGILLRSSDITFYAGQTALIEATQGSSNPQKISGGYILAPMIRSIPNTGTSSVVSENDDLSQVSVRGAFVIELFGFSGVVERDNAESIESGEQANSSGASIINYVRIESLDGAALVTTEDGRMAGCKPSIEFNVAGSAHFPLAKGNTPARGKITDGTWHINGNISFQEVQPQDQGLMYSMVDFNEASILVDGEPLNSAATPLAVTSVGLLALALAALKAAPTLTALLTRLPPDKALENENRRKLYAYITAHPGATFREVLRGTDMAAGTARHHLTVLARSKMIVEHGHRSTLRFFENHGKYDATWTSVVLLREEDLSRVYQWLTTHPNAFQRELLEFAESEWSWSRSTTQHRLARLIDGGLVQVNQAGRRKFYHAVAPDSAEPLAPKASWT